MYGPAARILIEAIRRHKECSSGRPVAHNFGDSMLGIGLALLITAPGWKTASVVQAVPLDLTVLGALIGGVGVVALHIRYGLTFLPQWLPIYVLIMAFIVPVLASSTDPFAVDKMWRLGSLTAASLLFPLASHNRQRTAWVLITYVVASCVLVAALSLAIGEDYSSSQRLGSFDDGPINLGRLAGGGALGLVLLARVGKLRWVWAWPGIVASILAMVGSGTRGPVFALLLSVCIVSMPRRHIGGSAVGLRRLAVPGLLLFVIFAGAQFDALPGARRVRMIWDLAATWEGEARLPLFRESIDLIARNVWGHGWGSYQLETGNLYPHNIILEVGTEAGLLSLAILLVVMGVPMVRLFRSRHLPLCNVVMGLFVYAFTIAQFSGSLNGQRFLFAMVGLSYAIVGPLRVPFRARSKAASLEASGSGHIWV